MTGTCKFCNQTMIVQDAENQNEADNYATMNCNCKEGREYRNIEDMKDAAKENAKSLFTLPDNPTEKQIKEHDELIKLMGNIIDNVAEGNIEKCSLKISERITASIFITAKDGIRIKKNYKEEYVLEANHY